MATNGVAKEQQVMRQGKAKDAAAALDALIASTIGVDEDFDALRRFVNNPEFVEDDDLRALRKVVNDGYRRRLRDALNCALDRIAERRSQASDRRPR
jgi:hypothetical protein